MKKLAKLYLCTVVFFIMVLAAVVSHYQGEILAITKANEMYVSELQEQHKTELTKYEAYEYLYSENQKDLEQSQSKLKKLTNEYENFKKNIAYAKDHPIFSRGTTTDLTKFNPISTEELNEWIESKAPSDSPFIGKASAFIEASHRTGLDPKYIVAHAALESGWGRSPIARDKNNFFGIAAYNASAYKSAKTFNSIEDGIIAGSEWINNNYITQGQNTLQKMIYGPKSYSINDRGLPNSKWISKVASIMIN